MKKIVVLGRHQFMMDKVLPLLQNNGFEAIGFISDEEIVNHISQNEVDVVVFGGGVEQVSREQIMNVATETNGNIKFIVAKPQSIVNDLKNLFE